MKQEQTTQLLIFSRFPVKRHSITISFVFISATQLKPEEVEFHIEENRKAHKTADYEAEKLIIRRGQTFDVTVTFNREYKPDIDTIVLQFVTGLFSFQSFRSPFHSR